MRNPDIATPFERLASARHSSDLTMEERRRGDADYLAAAGMATHSRLGAAVVTAHTGGSRQDLKASQQAVLGLVKRMNARRGWRLNGENTERVATLALLHHVAPVCPTCSGRKFTVVPGTARLSGTACPHCHGTGIRPLGKRNRDEVAAVLTELSMIEHVVERAIGRLVR